jgi:hypothetical protein
MLLTVAVAFPGANSLLGIYMRRSGAMTLSSRYQNPATLPGLWVELMFPPSLNGPHEGYSPRYAEDYQKVSPSKSFAIRRKQAIAVTTSAARSGPDSGRMTPNPVMEELPTSQNRCILCNALRSGQRNGHHREGGQFESSVVRCYIFIGDT